MIDYFALGLTHFLLLLALVRIAGRAALDREPELEAEYRRGARHLSNDPEPDDSQVDPTLTDLHQGSRDD